MGGDGGPGRTKENDVTRREAGDDGQATNRSGIPLKPYYAASDWTGDREPPGEYPYTRGLHPGMYRKRLWTMRQYGGIATSGESNRRFKFLLAHGQTGLSVAFDLPTQIGLDPDDPLAAEEVGKVGVSISTLADVERMFEGIPLGGVSTSMTINATASILLGMYIVAAEKQGVAASELSGTLQNDLLKEFVARGTYAFPLEPSMRLAVDVMEYCARHLPRFNPISVSGYHMREAGATAVEEAAFAVANARATIERLLARGLSIDDFAPRISWIFNTHSDLFEEVAKYRALRRVWARLLKETYGAKDPRSWMLRTHTQTGGVTLTAQQPENNIARAALQALAAVLGGVQSLALSCYDEALAIPTEKAQQIALRTQQIVAHESGAAAVADPLGGSHYVERLTDEMQRLIEEELRRIEEMGGAERAVETQHYAQRIAESAWREEQALARGERVVVGLNRYVEDVGGAPPEIYRSPPTTRDESVASLHEVKRRRDAARVKEALEQLERACRGNGNLMPPILDAVRAYASVGEMTGAMANVFGRAEGSRLI